MAISREVQQVQIELPQSEIAAVKPLRFITCGNVDDGKSTLIGRLLWDTKSVKSDHADEISARPIQLPSGETHPDFANLLDGLQAEREQGITIDVAYRYFSSAKRSFIVADTPGHEQYTRNMVTGASTADVAVLLVDAQTGVSQQTRRHALVASLMGIKTVVLAVNKMDLVGFDQKRFEAIEAEFQALQAWIDLDHLIAIPVAAVHGSNVVARDREKLGWYQGPTLLEALEQAELARVSDVPFRLNVQRVSRPDERFRGFQGTLQGGALHVGDEVLIQRSNHRAKVSQILTFDGPVDAAAPGDAITLVLDRKLDIARGDMIADPARPMQSARTVTSRLIVLDDEGLQPGKRYWLKAGAHKQRVTVRAQQTVDLATGKWEDRSDLGVNAISIALLSFEEVFYFDRFEDSPHTGAFILIDPDDYRTVAGGMVEGIAQPRQQVVPANKTIQVELPADLARDILSLASRDNRLDELTVNLKDDGDFDAGWIRELEAQGLTFTAHPGS